MIEYEHDPADGVAEQIARYVARLIDDRSTLQIGLGRVTNQMLAHLTNRNDLAIHSDVITEPLVDLVAAGVVSGPVVGTWAMGTRRLYACGRRAALCLPSDRPRLRPGVQMLHSRAPDPVTEGRDVELRDRRRVRVQPTRTSDRWRSAA